MTKPEWCENLQIKCMMCAPLIPTKAIPWVLVDKLHLQTIIKRSDEVKYQSLSWLTGIGRLEASSEPTVPVSYGSEQGCVPGAGCAVKHWKGLELGRREDLHWQASQCAALITLPW